MGELIRLRDRVSEGDSATLPTWGRSSYLPPALAQLCDAVPVKQRQAWIAVKLRMVALVLGAALVVAMMHHV